MVRLSLLLVLALLSTPAAAQRRKAPPPVPMAAAQPAEAPSVRGGVALWQQCDWAAAVEMWRPFADGGNADAMFNLGQAYQLGRGLPQDDVAALAWYEAAAARGHRPGLANQGIMLFKQGQKTQALALLKRAADAGEPRAQYVFGTAAWNGDGREVDLALAYAYLARAAEQGLAEARASLDLLVPRLGADARAAGWARAATIARADGSFGVPQGIGAPYAPSLMALAGDGAWRVQIGAFSTQAGAEADLVALKSCSSAVFEGLTPVFVPGGSLVRLQLGPFASREAARAGCARFVALGRGCLVVAPAGS